jgi:cytoskeleton protein RodZ
MRTGNAGGLEITVDGVPAPPIGAKGMVRRNVALDGHALLTGSAVRN